MFNQLGMLADLMRNAGKLRESVQSLGDLEVEGQSGGGSVKVKVSGRFEVTSVHIDPKLVTDGDAELLEDLIAAATNDAVHKVEARVQEKMGGLTAGLALPPGMKLPF